MTELRTGEYIRDNAPITTSPGVGGRSTVAIPPGIAGWEGDCASQKQAEALADSGPRFSILRLHRAGGIGEVLVALDRELGREVAVKRLSERNADKPDYQRRFLHEAEITGRLEHPSVMPVYGLGRFEDGRTYYAMRFIDYKDLEDEVVEFHADSAPPLDRGERGVRLLALLRRFLAVCSAIAYAHSRGVLHLDLKPRNVLLGPYGETLVADWGSARPYHRPGEPGGQVEGALHDPRYLEWLEREGKIEGTIAYMSPEMAGCCLETLSPSSDVYSLGATLYHLLTGRPAIEFTKVSEGLEKVRSGEFAPPRLVEPKIPRPLEAICLKAMALDPARRYPSPEELARDVERWLADEPVLAWPEPWSTRAGRWARRHKPLTAGLVVAAFVALMVVILAIGRVNALLAALQSAKTREVPQVVEQIEQLGPSRILVDGRLRSIVKDESGDSEVRLHAALALMSVDASPAGFLADRMLRPETPPETLLVILRLLQRLDRMGLLAPSLKEALSGAEATDKFTDRQLLAAGALAWAEPDHESWARLAAKVVERLVVQNIDVVGDWRSVFEPVADHLKGPLQAIYDDDARPESQRQIAFRLLLHFASLEEVPDRIDELAALVEAASPEQFGKLMKHLRQSPGRSIGRLEPRLVRPTRFDDERASRMGRLAAALLILGREDPVWPLFVAPRHGDPSVRSQLIHSLAVLPSEPAPVLGRLLRRLETEAEPSAKRTLILALDGLPFRDLARDEQGRLMDRFLDHYRNDPDPGVHGAVDWLLRHRWGAGRELDRADRDLAAAGVPDERHWYVSRRGLTFSILRGPIDFEMGSTKASDPDRHIDEKVHKVRIPRTFAIGTREVTVQQYQQFLRENPDVQDPLEDEERRNLLTGGQLPIIGVNWYDVARFCNWLSQQEGIPEDQWCYPRDIGPGRPPPDDFLHRTGYRLPTEAECEHAFRGGSSASRFYGGSEALLQDYAWFSKNSGGHLQPVGRLRPNDYGLFDVLGNAFEWTHDTFGDYPAGAVVDTEKDEHSAGMIRVIRGGSLIDDASVLRSAYRDYYFAKDRDRYCGFRVARTIRWTD